MTAAVAPQEPKPVPWWLVLVEGVLAIILGIMFFMNPGWTSVVVVQVIAIYWLVSGIFQLVSIFFDSTGWGWKLFGGIIGILAGLFLLGEGFYAAIALGTAFVWVLGFLGIVYGVIYIIQFFQGAGWGAIIWGVLSIILGIILLANTLIAASTLPWVLGTFLVVGGIFAIFAAFKLR